VVGGSWGRSKKQALRVGGRDQPVESERMNKCPPHTKKGGVFFFHFILWLDATGNVLYLTYSSEKDEQHAGG